MSEAKVALMEQHPGTDATAESPLHHTLRDSPATGSPGVILRERALLGHLVLRGDAGNAAFRDGAATALGTALPQEPLSLVTHGDIQVQWISPDEWLVILPGGREHNLEVALRDALSGHYSVVNVSGGQTVIHMQGPNARDVLMKSAPYNFHPRNFPVGKGVVTVFAKAGANIRRVDENAWELVVRRSFADYVWRWLLDAGEEYGVAVEAS